MNERMGEVNEDTGGMITFAIEGNTRHESRSGG
jgi:hypothetical protein